jgi:hypothetical protein
MVAQFHNMSSSDEQTLRRLVFMCDDSEMRQLLLGWKDSGVTQNEAEQRLLAIWRELDEKNQPAQVGFLENWIDVVIGHVGPGARIW